MPWRVTIAGGKPARGLICASYGPFRQAVSIQTPPQAAGGDRRGLPSSSPMTGRFCMDFCDGEIWRRAWEKPLLSTLLSSFLLSSFYLFVYLHLRATRKWTHLQVDPLDSQRAWLRQHAPVAFSASNQRRRRWKACLLWLSCPITFLSVVRADNHDRIGLAWCAYI